MAIPSSPKRLKYSVISSLSFFPLVVLKAMINSKLTSFPHVYLLQLINVWFIFVVDVCDGNYMVVKVEMKKLLLFTSLKFCQFETF